jgi:hypothetical protein
VAPKVASLMAAELEQNRQWEAEQVESFQRMGERYLPGKLAVNAHQNISATKAC